MRDHEHDITLDRLADYLEGRLGKSEAEAVRQALEGSEELRAEYRWLESAASDFHAIGEQVVADAPEVDLLAGVMREVEKADAAAKVVRLESRASARRPRALWAAVALAAAVLLFVAGLAYQAGLFGPAGPEGPRVVEGPSEAPDSPERLEARQPEPDDGSDELAEAVKLLAEGVSARIDSHTKQGKRGEFASTPAPEIGAVSRDDVVALRQAAIADPAAWSRLHQMATLETETARAVASDPQVSPAAVVGAAASLPDEEARQRLVTAIGRMDENKPYAQLAVAKTYLDPPAPQPDAPLPTLFDGMSADDLRAFLGEVRVLQEAHPENALYDALRAGALLRLGDTEGALTALNSLQGKEFAAAYGLDSARAQQSALAAAGMSEDASRMLSAFLAGSDQYNMLCDLARDLLQSGQAYEAQGDPEVARDVYEATQRLGEQVTEGAQLSQEALAGVDIQRMAIEELEVLYETTDLVGEIEQLTASTLELVNQINALGGMLESLDQLFFSGGDSSFWNQLSEQILQLGDLSLFQSPQT